jgi:hypothetical protein
MPKMKKGTKTPPVAFLIAFADIIWGELPKNLFFSDPLTLGILAHFRHFRHSTIFFSPRYPFPPTTTFTPSSASFWPCGILRRYVFTISRAIGPAALEPCSPFSTTTAIAIFGVSNGA